MSGPGGPEGDAELTRDEERLRQLELQVEALTDAVNELARGLSDGPAAEDPLAHAAQAGRRAHELMLLAGQHRRSSPGAPAAEEGNLP